MEAIQYRGYTIKQDWRNPYGNKPEYKFFPTDEGEDDDADFDGETYSYTGNGKWADSLEDAMLEIDDIITETIINEWQ